MADAAHPDLELMMIGRWIGLVLVFLCSGAWAQTDDATALFMRGMDATEAVKIHDQIYQATGFGNTLMVTTPEGNVIIDTSIAFMARKHHQLLTAVSDAPVKYIILTHAHGDHTGGVKLWKGDDTEVIAQDNHVEFLHYQHRLRGIFGARNAAQFPRLAAMAPERYNPETSEHENFGAEIPATILFDDEYRFELGGLTFVVMHTPGETYDHCSVWIPELKAVFTGDNFYESFPNMYTLRGTQPRWALDYTASLDKVLALKPEIMVPSHGFAVMGNSEITRQVTRYRDAILYVHDETVRGMNAGKDVYELMQTITLPEALDIGEGYGTIAWSVRGIFEGYMGWFDGNPSTMSSTPAKAAYPELVEMAGGAEKVAQRAVAMIEDGRVDEALHLVDMALTADPENLTALRAKLSVLQAARGASTNANEAGWLEFGIRDTQGVLDRLDEQGKR